PPAPAPLSLHDALPILAREAQRRRPSELENSAVSHERRSVARARIQASGGWDYCQPVDPVGLLQARRRLGWLSPGVDPRPRRDRDRKSTRLNSSHVAIS